LEKKNCNIAVPFVEMAKERNEETAVAHQKERGYEVITFADLERETAQLASALAKYGIGKGTKTVLMVRPSIKFIAVTFALFRIGAVPVFIDPGMGVDNFLNCVRQVKPEGFIGVTKAHIMRLMYRKDFKSVKHLVTIGRKFFWGGLTYADLLKAGSDSFDTVKTECGDTAAIIFTTGSTGPPKGVTYTHDMFNMQRETIKGSYGISPGDVDLSAFPLFALFSVSLGMKSVIPDMDPTAPADVDPEKIINAVNEQKATFTFGSPAIWENVSRHAVEFGVKLPTMKKILMAGAPVRKEIHERLLTNILPDGAETHTPYGATESLPISDMTGSEVLADTGKQTALGAGICVGRPLPGSDIKIIKINDGEIPEWKGVSIVADGDKGEIVVKSRVASASYFGLESLTAMAKIKDGDTFRHRMGDIGYFDDKGRLWFCGRKGHRVITVSGTLYPICTEAIFNRHPAVRRSALVGLGQIENGNQRPVIIIELEPDKSDTDRDALTAELIELGSKHKVATMIKDILYYELFPTDIRHNAKIFREKLKSWAEGEIPELVPS
jgi:acyl-coenzyme A synthetase/AMP-(fatty) acid ligase